VVTVAVATAAATAAATATSTAVVVVVVVIVRDVARPPRSDADNHPAPVVRVRVVIQDAIPLANALPAMHRLVGFVIVIIVIIVVVVAIVFPWRGVRHTRSRGTRSTSSVSRGLVVVVVDDVNL